MKYENGALMHLLIIIFVTFIDASPLPASKGSSVPSPLSTFDFPWLTVVDKEAMPSSPQESQTRVEFLKSIMPWLSFRDAYHLVSRTKAIDTGLNILEHLALNPLIYHDARLDNQAALKLVLKLHPRVKLRYLHHLLKNPSVDFSNLDDSVLKDAIRYKDLELIRNFLENKIFPEKQVLTTAFTRNLDLLKEILENDQFDSTNIGFMFKWAVSNRNYELAQFLIDKFDVEPNYYELNWITEYGDLELIKKLVTSHDIKISVGTLFAACKSGKLDVLKYVLENYKGLADKLAVCVAAGRGHLAIVRHLMEVEGVPFDNRMLDVARLHRMKDVEEYLKRRRNNV